MVSPATGAPMIDHGIIDHGTAAPAARSPGGALIVLLYHRVLPEVGRDHNQLAVSARHFAAHLEWLQRHTVVLDERAFLDCLSAASAAGGAARRTRVLLTFDDGYADNLHYAAPLLSRRRCGALLFAASGLIGSGAPFWWDALEQLVFAAHRPSEWRLPDLPGPCPAEPAERAYAALHAHLRVRPLPEQMDCLAILARQAGFTPVAERDARPLTWDELRAWRAAGFDVGAHTRTHPVLASLPDAAIADELEGSVRDLSARLGVTIRTCSYPYGTRRDFDERAARVAAQAGLAAAFANVPGLVPDCVSGSETTSGPGSGMGASDRYRIPRFLVRDVPVEELAARISAWVGWPD